MRGAIHEVDAAIGTHHDEAGRYRVEQCLQVFAELASSLPVLSQLL
ncbi:MAG: hypothetical protein WDO12_00055 [Pseudomonadota bacterium]